MVREAGDGFEIVAGERRWKAAGIAGLETVPVVVRSVSDDEILVLALVENLQRSDLNPIEAARGYRHLMEQGDLTQEALSQIDKYRHIDNTDQLRKYMLQNASTFQQNLRVNVSTARSQSVLSLLYEDQHKIYKRNQDKKYMVGFRNRTNLFKWLDLTVNGTYNYTGSNNSNTGLPSLSPYENLVDSQGNYIRYSGGVSLNYL